MQQPLCSGAELVPSSRFLPPYPSLLRLGTHRVMCPPNTFFLREWTWALSDLPSLPIVPQSSTYCRVQRKWGRVANTKLKTGKAEEEATPGVGASRSPHKPIRVLSWGS